MEVVRENLYGLQLRALRRYIKFYFGKSMNFPEINRPQKNAPLSIDEKKRLEGFSPIGYLAEKRAEFI